MLLKRKPAMDIEKGVAVVITKGKGSSAELKASAEVKKERQ